MRILVVENSICGCDYSFLLKYGIVSQVDCAILHTKSCDEWLSDIDCVIFSGGPQHLYEIEKYPELFHELELLGTALKKRLRIIGICLGFQLINHYFGNTVVSLKAPCIGHGFMDDSLPSSYKFLHHAFSFHYDGVFENISDKLIVLGRSVPIVGCRGGLIYFVKHIDLPVFGVQVHPEVTVNRIIECVKSYNERDVEMYAPEHYVMLRQQFFDALLLPSTTEVNRSLSHWISNNL